MNILSNLPGWNKRSVRFYKLFLSYLLLVFFFLTVVGGVVYGGIISALQKEVEQAQLSAVAQIRDTMDTRLRELQRIALQISANPLLTPYALSQYGYDSYQAVSELNKYRTSNSFIHNILLNYSVSSFGSSNPSSGSNRVFAASGVYGEQELYQKIYRYADWSYGSLTKMIQSMNGPVIRPVETVYTNNGTRESRFATYLYPLPAYSGKPNGVVMFLLDEVNLQSMSGQLVSRPGTALYLVDGQGRTIFQTGQASVDMEKIAGEITAETGSVSTRTLDGIAYSVVRQELAYNGWSFITVVPTSLFLEKVEQSRRLFGAILLILLGLGAVTSFVLANSSYQKLRQLVQLFSDKKQPGSHNVKTTDELVYLSNAIREFSGQDSMTFKLQSKKGLIREHILLSLLKNKPQQTDELLQTLELAEVRFEHPDFVTVLLAIDDYADFQAAHSASVQELLKFRMVKAAEEQAAEIGRGYGVTLLDERGIALVLNIGDTSEVERKLYAFADNIQTFFQKYHHFTISIGVGRVYPDLLSIGKSYGEAHRALHYRFVRGNNQVLFYERLQTHMDDNKRGYPHELEDQLLKSIRQGNPDEAERTIDRIISSVRVSSATPEAAQITCMGLLHLLMKAADGIQSNDLHLLFQEPKSLNPYHIETIDTLQKQMVAICRRICECVSERKESRNYKLRDDILRFLQERYPDNSLSLETIAEHFGMSSSYITRFIKDQTGYSMIRYLDLLRMEKAKELLLSGYLNLPGIMKEVGYVDVSNFIKKFKKLEGVTPEQYRNLRAKY